MEDFLIGQLQIAKRMGSDCDAAAQAQRNTTDCSPRDLASHVQTQTPLTRARRNTLTSPAGKNPEDNLFDSFALPEQKMEHLIDEDALRIDREAAERRVDVAMQAIKAKFECSNSSGNNRGRRMVFRPNGAGHMIR
jgi:hypothetical protein